MLYSFFERETDRRDTIVYLVYNNRTRNYETVNIEGTQTLPVELWVDNYFGFILIRNLYCIGDTERFDAILKDFKELCTLLNIEYDKYYIRYY